MIKGRIIVRYSEIFLKSCPVYRRFEGILINNIREGFKDNSVKAKITRERGRIFVETQQIKKASSVLERIFGITSFSPCFHLESSKIKKIQDFVKKNHSKWVKKNEKFAIRAKRIGNHDYNSQELAKLVGDVVDRKVDLTNPDVEIFVEVRNDNCYIYTESVKGTGGLPLGSAGTVVSLMSGGIDSAVAAWLMMKRGCKIVAVYGKVGGKENKAVKKIVKKLQEWHIGSTIKFFTFNQEKILKVFNEKFYRHTCILCKRNIYRMGNKVAKKLRIKGLVTGEALSQVASQTLDNLMVLDQASELPVFRPLISMDKEDIIKIAKILGTYEIAIGHKENCWACPIKPRTRSSLDKILSFERNVEKEITDAIKVREIKKF